MTMDTLTGDIPGRKKPRYATGAFLLAVHIVALAALLPGMTTWPAVAVGAVLYYLTGGIGICLGYHRMLTHRSLSVPKPVEYIIATLGALALQGDPLKWISTHRAHHAHSDTERDPHNSNRGFWWAHLIWLVAKNPARLSAEEIRHYGPDLVDDPYYRILGVAVLPMTLVLGIALFMAGGWPFVIWGIFVRLVVVYHITWFVNSASHLDGYQTFKSKDNSTNNWWVAFLAWGEGWHNNHHAFPASARHGMAWYEFDFTWLTIRFMQSIGLAKDVRLMRKESIDRARHTAPLHAQTEVISSGS
jgi:fatty-acid desaturase